VCYLTGRVAPFFSSSDPSLSQEVADGKISVQSACALNTVYNQNSVHSCEVRGFPRRWDATRVTWWVSTDTSKNLLPPSACFSATNQLVYIFFTSLARLQVFKTVLPTHRCPRTVLSSWTWHIVQQWFGDVSKKRCLHLRGLTVRRLLVWLIHRNMKMKAAGSSETSVKMYTDYTVSHPRRHYSSWHPSSQAIKYIKLHFRLQVEETTVVLKTGEHSRSVKPRASCQWHAV
jgi:hypothetical protein